MVLVYRAQMPPPPQNGRRMRRSTAAGQGEGDEEPELAALFCRMFARPAGTVPIVLNVDDPDHALTAAFQADSAALAAIYRDLPCPAPGDDPGHRAAIREAIG